MYIFINLHLYIYLHIHSFPHYLDIFHEGFVDSNSQNVHKNEKD